MSTTIIDRPLAAADPADRAGADGAGDRDGTDGPLLGHARDVRVADVHRPTGSWSSPPRTMCPMSRCRPRLCAAARRGVATTIVFPARNDSWIVAAASHSYYADLLAAGVRIFEYEGGLLHTKSLTLDGEITLIGSANMDRRSFELNYENNILFYDRELTAQDASAPGHLPRPLPIQSRPKWWPDGPCAGDCGTTPSPCSVPCFEGHVSQRASISLAYAIPQNTELGPRLFSRGKWTMAGSRPTPPRPFNGAAAFQPRKAADRLLHFVSERREMIRYPEFRERGWQIGSGPTESQCKLCTKRLKGYGRRWDRPNATAVAALDTLDRNGQWHQVWPNARPVTT